MEDSPDHLVETVSLGVDPNSVFNLPDGCSFIAPPKGGPDQLVLVLSKHEANTCRAAFDSLFGEFAIWLYGPLFMLPQISIADL